MWGISERWGDEGGLPGGGGLWKLGLADREVKVVAGAGRGPFLGLGGQLLWAGAWLWGLLEVPRRIPAQFESQGQCEGDYVGMGVRVA